MRESGTKWKQRRKKRADELFRLACKEEESHNFRSALELYLSAAKAGDTGALVNVGHFYDKGIGVPADSAKALYWYTRAYRRGEASGAANIGTVWRDRSKFRRALFWFRRAAEMGDDESNLEIAKIHLRNRKELRKAIEYLVKVCGSNSVTEAGAEEAQQLLDITRRKIGLAARLKMKRRSGPRHGDSIDRPPVRYN